ncbi:MAG TPA: tetraacyldisaccharide 4'-kinase [Noviherbaspirillum sp.]|nr:tetraacyldisaccharide 4'-kinase [Noviherbaspirillum sp.]
MPAPHSLLETTLTRAWLARGALAWLLVPVALLFLCIVTLRRALYRAGLLRSERVGVPVVVVGNVFVGGTGKTPFTIWLVQALRGLGFVPGVVSRGYGASSRKPTLVNPSSSAAEVGDEPLLIARRAACPVVVGRERVAAARALLAAFPNVNLIIADDGLQHYALARDVEIVLCDARGNGNGWLLPAGPLREPASRRRDFTVVNGDVIPPGLPQPVFQMRLNAPQALHLADAREQRPLPAFAAAGLRVAAAAGIGNPERFFTMLRDAGVPLADTLALPDHYDFAHDPFAHMHADAILITEKDAVKCLQLESFQRDPRLWVVPVSAEVDPALAHRIVEKCRGLPTA